MTAAAHRPGGRPTTAALRRAMVAPMQCLGCHHVFDAANVEVTARYADCSVWRCPGCGAAHDDRPAWGRGPGVRNGCVDLNARDRAIAEHREEHGW